MRAARQIAPRPLFPKFIADCEERIAQQHQLIAELKQKGLLTSRAEADLKKQKVSLRQLKIHAAVMRFLMEP
jgi:hypothetical protein